MQTDLIVILLLIASWGLEDRFGMACRCNPRRVSWFLRSRRLSRDLGRCLPGDDRNSELDESTHVDRLSRGSARR